MISHRTRFVLCIIDIKHAIPEAHKLRTCLCVDDVIRLSVLGKINDFSTKKNELISCLVSNEKV